MAETRFEWALDGEDAGSDPWEFDSIVEVDDTFALDANNPNNGINGYREISTGIANDRAYGIKTWTNTDKTEYWVRFYVYIPSGQDLNQATFMLEIAMFFDGASEIGSFGVRGNGQVVPNEWVSNYRGFTSNSSTNFSLDTRHRIEIQHISDGAAGGLRFYVDGVSVHQNQDQADTDFFDTLHLGVVNAPTYFEAAGYIDFDDIVGDVTQPGAYSDDAPGPPPTGNPVAQIMQQMNQFNGGTLN